jgi:hypothetical protein
VVLKINDEFAALNLTSPPYDLPKILRDNASALLHEQWLAGKPKWRDFARPGEFCPVPGQLRFASGRVNAAKHL